MADDPPFGDFTLAQIRAFRDALKRRMLFEPVASDPGFKREVEKLRFLIQQTKGFIDRLASAVAKADLSKEVEMERAKAKAMEDRIRCISEEWTYDSEKEKERLELSRFAPPEEQMRLIEREHEHSILIGNAMTVAALFGYREYWFVLADFQSANARLRAMELWLFLKVFAEAVSAGTEDVFHLRKVPVQFESLLEAALDMVPKASDFSPVLHLVKAMLDYIRRSDKYSDEMEKDWEKTEKSFFLYIYFDWWTESKGRDVVDDLVSKTEDFALGPRSHLDSARKLIEAVATRLEEFERQERAFNGLPMAG